MIQIYTSLGIVIFILQMKPLESTFFNKLECFNEICIICLTYTTMCFTDFLPDPQTRSELGLYYIALNAFMISVHMYLLVKSIVW